MRKILIFILATTCVMSLLGCDATEPVATEPPIVETQNVQQTEISDIQEENEVAETENATESTRVIFPLPESLNLNNLNECTMAVSLSQSGLYKDENGNTMMRVTVFTQDLYDMIDVAALKENDVMIINQAEVVVSSIERANNSVLINGGLDNGGYELRTDDNTVYYLIGYSDVLSYHELKEISLPVSADFIYTDCSDLDVGEVTMNVDEMMSAENLDYHFTPHNTTIQVSNGAVISLTRVYAP